MQRISTAYQSQRSIADIQSKTVSIAKLQKNLSSGKKLLNPSDDPTGLAQLLYGRSELKNNERYTSNIDSALSELTSTESAMSGMKDAIQRIKELTVQAANDTLSQTQLDSINLEVNNLFDTLVQLGNSNYNGNYLFSGFEVDTAPFTVTGQDVAYGGSPNTTPNLFERPIEVNKNDTIAINFNGEDLLGTVTVTGPTTTTGSGILRTVRQLTLDLANGNKANVRTRLDELDTGLETILDNMAVIGSKVNRLELLKTRYEEQGIAKTEFLSTIESTDFAEVVSRLGLEQSLYEATLSLIQRMSSQSVLNFLN